MATQKPLMKVSETTLDDLAVRSQTGMGFYVTESLVGWLIVLENGDAMPIGADRVYFSLPDLLNGEKIPELRQTPSQLSIYSTHGS